MTPEESKKFYTRDELDGMTGPYLLPEHARMYLKHIDAGEPELAWGGLEDAIATIAEMEERYITEWRELPNGQWRELGHWKTLADANADIALHYNMFVDYEGGPQLECEYRIRRRLQGECYP